MNNLELSTQLLLTPAEIDSHDLSNIIKQLNHSQIDLADIYLQTTFHEAFALEDGAVKDASFNLTRGAGIRAISGDKTGFAYTDAINLPQLKNAANYAQSIALYGQHKTLKVHSQANTHALYSNLNPLTSLSAQQKIALLEDIDKEARRQDPRIIRVESSLSASYSAILIINNEGLIVPDIRPLVRVNVQVIAAEKDRYEQGSAGGGARSDYHYILDSYQHLDFARDAARQALLNLEAIDAPAGSMPVVLGAGWPGVLLHEAVGHGLEGDANRKGASVFANKIGQKVASELCTIVDNGTLPQRRGSLNVDDEGTATQETVLIENGKLCGYMQDKLNAKLMNTRSTGNGRRESYAHPTIPRMTNTYMRAGEHVPDEIIASVKKGIYAVNFNGGQVDVTSGKFVFSTSEAYLIENGKVTTPIKGATLIGDGLSVLNKVSMVGNDLKLDAGIGTCGKDGQSVAVGVGQPTLKVDEMIVGGTKL